MQYTVFNEEVLYTAEPLTRIAGADVELLKDLALKNSRQRIRLCAHPDMQDTLHEMIIVFARDSYVRPHMHLDKSESFHIIEGHMAVLIFDAEGALQNVFRMGPAASGETFFYRLSESSYHTVIPQSPLVVFHEATNGPFRREDTLYAPWAPDDIASDAVNKYTARLAAAAGCLSGECEEII